MEQSVLKGMFRFICGDCIQEMAKLPTESFDAAITSPPYNIGVKYRSYSDKKSEADYLDWTLDWCGAVKRVLKPDGSLFLNLAGSSKQPWLPFEVVQRLREIFVLQNTFHWIKAISLDENTSVGHFKPVNSSRYVTSTHEYVFQFTKTGSSRLNRLALGVKYKDQTNIKRWKHTNGQNLRCRGNVWFVPYPTVQSFADRPHPAVFPSQLAANCIRISDSKSIIDPFVGIGSTGVAARSCGVEDFVGIDIDETYLKTAQESVSPTIADA